mgnify:CR=1 FL=1
MGTQIIGMPSQPDKGGSLLYLDNVSKSFDGFKAINALSLVIGKGEMRAIIGPNGAGKTTMMDIITGKTRPDEGQVLWGETSRSLLKMNEAQIARAGVPVVLHEMRPAVETFAHRTGDCAEMVCSNSFRSDDAMNNAVGLLHEEMRRANSLILACGDAGNECAARQLLSTGRIRRSAQGCVEHRGRPQARRLHAQPHRAEGAAVVDVRVPGAEEHAVA